MRFLEHIETLPQDGAVAQDIEYAAADAAAGWSAWTEPGFGEVNGHAVAAGRHGNHVAQISEAYGPEQLRVGGALHGLRANRNLASASVPIRLPNAALFIGVGAIQRSHTNRQEPAGNSRSDLDGAQLGRI